MNIDKTFEGITAGMTNSYVALFQTQVPDEQMQTIGVRRKNASATHHTLWVLKVTWAGADANPNEASFYDHTPSKAIKKAMAWRGMPTVSRGPKAAKNGQAQAATA